MREADKTEIEQALLNGFVFRGSGSGRQAQGKVKTKAKRKGYITGVHGSGSAKKKADIRQRRANRHKK
ncbi:hypothetical protein [Alloprevotella tannerae]|jgi:hypothetical protein|uniref:hypothetical protein n=1 Tax=Alloprevotella tannerae TaxID=76122 RepID=UPI0028EE0BAF|nr:hypothetical protein [Alloprevotella tannerae]